MSLLSTRVRVAVGGVLAVLAPSLVCGATPAAAAAVTACPAGVTAEQSPAAGSEAAAQELAVLCGKPVEVLEAADELTKVVALPSGNFLFESSIEPLRVERSGRWIDVDTGLERGTDGKFRPRAAADVTFSAGGSGPFAVFRDGGAEFSLSWPTALPPAVVTEDSVIYQNVYPDVDLVARAIAGGFSHVLVVKTAAAASNPAVRETTYQVGGSASVTEAPGGGLTITGPQGVIAGAPPAAAWDSTRAAPKPSVASLRPLAKAADEVSPATAEPVTSESSSAQQPGVHARIADVDVSVAGRELTVKVDEALLDGQPSFPVFIDPPYQKVYQKWIPVSRRQPDRRWTSGNGWPRGDIRVGDDYDDHGDLWRAHFQFDISTLKGKRLIKTPSVDAWEEHTGHCGGEQISLWQTNVIDGNTPTWDGMKGTWLHGAALDTVTAKANARCGEERNGIKFDGPGVKTQVQRHATADYSTITFGLRVPNESDGHWVRLKRGSVKLTAEYQSRPSSPTPVRSSPGGNCAKTSPGPWINDRTPTLYGKAYDGDNSVRVIFDVIGPTSPPDRKEDAVASGREADWTTPTLSDGNYRWQVAATDDVETTDYSSDCFLRLDATPPTRPSITRTSGTPELGKPVTLSVASTDKLSGVQRFDYGIGDDVAQDNEAASSGRASITFTPDSGRTQVYVWARDNAGNLSTRATYDVFTGRVTPIQPMGIWRMTRDLRDDSGTVDESGNTDVNPDQKDLQATSTGVSFGTDRDGNTHAALALTGAGCASTIPVLQSDEVFTAAGWVKMADKDADRTLVALSGNKQAAFFLKYDASVDRWEAAISSDDTADPTWSVARATTAGVLNGWQHVAASVDPKGKVLRLYLGGKLVAETLITNAPWAAERNTTIGCIRTAAGTRAEMDGLIDQVGMWSGLLTEAQIAAAADELPAGIVASWALRKSGDDGTGHDYDLSVPRLARPAPAPDPAEPTNPGEPGDDPSEPVEVSEVLSGPAPENNEWTDDPFGRPLSAWQVTGDRCATSARTVVRSDESFSLAAWARLDDAGADNQTVIGANGDRVSGWFLGARANGQGVPVWSLMMKATDSETSASEAADGTTGAFAATVGKWTHLVGTYNSTTRTMTLFVNGKKVASEVRSGSNWLATGSLTVGCGKYADKPARHFRGAITDVNVWRGALTAAEATAVKGANPPVQMEGMWPLEGPQAEVTTNLEDRSGNARHLRMAGEPSWKPDRHVTRDGALGLALKEGSCAETRGGVVRTDGSFSVAAWVSFDELSGTRTVVSQSGAVRQGFRIEYFGEDNRLRAVMTQSDTSDGLLVQVPSRAAPVAGTWTHVAAVYDLPAKKLRFYVNGELQGEKTAPSAPWHAAGPLTVGCIATTGDSDRFRYLGGVVDDVRVWSSTVDPDLFGTFAHS